MPSVFSKVISGEFPARFVFRSENVVSFLTINPIVPGHVLVVPVKETEHWIDLSDEELSELTLTSKKVAQAISKAFPCEKVASMVVGLEVPHVHIHLMPINNVEDVDFSRADPSPSPALLDAVQAKLIAALEDVSH